VCVDPHLLTFSGSFQQQCQRFCVMMGGRSSFFSQCVGVCVCLMLNMSANPSPDNFCSFFVYVALAFLLFLFIYLFNFACLFGLALIL